MARVKFIEVGRWKTTWEADLKHVDEASLVREIKNKRVLLSQDIAIIDHEIIVGGFRVVGRTELLDA